MLTDRQKLGRQGLSLERPGGVSVLLVSPDGGIRFR
jgi:hypothetical protein